MSRVPKKKENDLLHALAVAEEAEREHIAKRIHQVNTLLSLVKMNIRKADRGKGDKKVLEKVNEQNCKALEESMQIISQSVRDLSPPMFSHIGLVLALQDLCRKSNEGTEKIRLEVRGEPFLHLAPQSGIQLYRLSKDVIEYFLQQKKSIRITLSEVGTRHELKFQVDGVARPGDSFDTNKIKARAIAAEGKLQFGKNYIQVITTYGEKN